MHALTDLLGADAVEDAHLLQRRQHLVAVQVVVLEASAARKAQHAPTALRRVQPRTCHRAQAHVMRWHALKRRRRRRPPTWLMSCLRKMTAAFSAAPPAASEVDRRSGELLMPVLRLIWLNWKLRAARASQVRAKAHAH